MKKLITIVIITMLSTGVYAQVKCVPDNRGGICCWDVGQDGQFKPVVC
jgi:hypothetical protein